MKLLLLMPKTVPTINTQWFPRPLPCRPVPAQVERLGGEGDTGVVFAVGTPMPKSA